MGTRSITHIHEMKSLCNKEEIVCSFYRQFDGYPSGHGKDLSNWLKSKRLVNGIGAGFKEGADHNRAGQMAIELMHSLKSETSIECMTTGEKGVGEEYIYDIYYRDDDFYISTKDIYSPEKEDISKASEYDSDKVSEILDDDDD